MKKTFTQNELDTQYISRGSIYATDDECYKIIDTYSLNTLLEKLDALKDSQKFAYFRGKNVQFKTDKLSSAVSALDCTKGDTGKVIVSKREIEDLIESSSTGTISLNVMENFGNQVKSLKEEIANLKEENKSLKENSPKTLLKDATKRLEVSYEVFKKEKAKVAQLKEELERCNRLILDKDKEITALKNNVAAPEEIENLRMEIASLKEKRSSNTLKAREKALEVKGKKAKELASIIVSLAMKKYSAEEIREILYSDYSREVKPATVYRAISVREDNDRQRILDLYNSFPENFQGVFEQDIIKWFEANRIKKLHLITKEEFIKKYGEEALPTRDQSMTDEYFSEKDM